MAGCKGRPVGPGPPTKRGLYADGPMVLSQLNAPTLCIITPPSGAVNVASYTPEFYVFIVDLLFDYFDCFFYVLSLLGLLPVRNLHAV